MVKNSQNSIKRVMYLVFTAWLFLFTISYSSELLTDIEKEDFLDIVSGICLKNKEKRKVVVDCKCVANESLNIDNGQFARKLVDCKKMKTFEQRTECRKKIVGEYKKERHKIRKRCSS
ncbi:MAG: hypothetical protein LBC92_05480 [Rickettsiales bacterium]|jgi:hypothetical protein|nr:hypothetical protein [Rickettsiales bacterium]